jgi:hypothetical protein
VYNAIYYLAGSASMRSRELILFTGIAVFIVGGTVLTETASAQATLPWWDNFPRIVNFINQPCGIQAAVKTMALNADVASCDSAQDGTAGIWAQRITILEESGSQSFPAMQSAGLKTQTYFETFGQTSTYVVQVKKNPDGTYVKDQADPQLTKRFANWYGWNAYDGAGEIHWSGPHGYFGNEAFSSPYTLTHPRYGAPPAKYPDGTSASGYNGATTDPRNSLFYDACAGKDVNR